MELAVSYLFLRRAIGLIGSLLPIALPLGFSITTGQWLLLPSVSSYYYTDMRNPFVGAMCAVGIFLICYRYQQWDDILATLAGVFAIGVAMCPPVPLYPSGIARTAGVLHVVFAACFLVAMALMCWFLFTRSNTAASARPTGKNIRNLIYRVCAALVLLFTALAGLSSFAPQSFIDAAHPLFWCEALATFAFGLAWWIKGQTLFQDA
jgi:hydrogenase-4 membrane subunit HyfE